MEITTTHLGIPHTSAGINDTLTNTQIEKLLSTDPGSDIAVNVRYMPENKMMQNTGKELQFAFTVYPETQATFVGGSSQLNTYLMEHAIHQIEIARFDTSKMAAVKFTINEAGEVANVHVAESTRDKGMDTILLEAIHQMPPWQPAAYVNGTRTTQEFVFTLGNMESCLRYLFNIRRDL